MANKKNLSIEPLPNEEWRDIVGYEGLYQVSNLGRVKSASRKVTRGCYTWVTKDTILKPLNQGFYNFVNLYKIENGKKKQKKYYIHRMVAKAFIPNPENLPQIDHINGNSRNNNVENLRWCTQSQNINHINTKDRSKKLKKIAVYDLLDNFLGIYGSLTDASKIFSVPVSSISCLLNKKSGMNGKKIGLKFKAI